MKLLCLAPLLALGACSTLPPVNLCKGAELRRTGYTAIIRTADLYALTGRPVPQTVVLGREAAVLALEVLERNCPKGTYGNPSRPYSPGA